MERSHKDESLVAVIVPRVPGPVVPLELPGSERDEVDEFIDDLFGESDEAGPGLADAMLLIGGSTAIILSRVFLLAPVVLVAGLVAVGLGLILPIRWILHQFRSTRNDAKIDSLIGDGTVLRCNSVVVQELLRAHARLLTEASKRPTLEEELRAIGHGHLGEVATLLKGHEVSEAPEAAYVSDRTQSLERLADELENLVLGSEEQDRRRSMLAARLEVEALSGDSAIDQAEELVRKLRRSESD